MGMQPPIYVEHDGSGLRYPPMEGFDEFKVKVFKLPKERDNIHHLACGGCNLWRYIMTTRLNSKDVVFEI